MAISRQQNPKPDGCSSKHSELRGESLPIPLRLSIRAIVELLAKDPCLRDYLNNLPDLVARNVKFGVFANGKLVGEGFGSTGNDWDELKKSIIQNHGFALFADNSPPLNILLVNSEDLVHFGEFFSRRTGTE